MYSFFEYFLPMTFFPEGTRTPFARAISAEVRAVMAARRITGRSLAKDAGFASNNYLAIRLRDEKPFTLDDIEIICAFLDESDDSAEFIKRAVDNHAERLWIEAMDAQDIHDGKAEPAADRGARRLDIAWDPKRDNEEAEAASAVGRLDRHARDTRPTRKKSMMQQLDDQAARDEDSGA